MYTAIFTVTLRLPDTMSPEEARAALKTSVAFGQPVITHPYVIEDPAPERVHVVAIEDVQTGTEAL
jgi:hypothetical protein